VVETDWFCRFTHQLESRKGGALVEQAIDLRYSLSTTGSRPFLKQLLKNRRTRCDHAAK